MLQLLWGRSCVQLFRKDFQEEEKRRHGTRQKAKNRRIPGRGRVGMDHLKSSALFEPMCLKYSSL